jgi:hypothetical protein
MHGAVGSPVATPRHLRLGWPYFSTKARGSWRKGPYFYLRLASFGNALCSVQKALGPRAGIANREKFQGSFYPAPEATRQKKSCQAPRCQNTCKKHLARTCVLSVIDPGRQEQEQEPVFRWAGVATTGIDCPGDCAFGAKNEPKPYSPCLPAERLLASWDVGNVPWCVCVLVARLPLGYGVWLHASAGREALKTVPVIVCGNDRKRCKYNSSNHIWRLLFYGLPKAPFFCVAHIIDPETRRKTESIPTKRNTKSKERLQN